MGGRNNIMLNQFILVGKIKHLPEIIGNDQYELCVEVTQTYKNSYGEYVSSDINVILTARMTTNLENYCKVGDLIGVKGYIDRDNELGMVLKGTKVTFLSSRAPSIEEHHDGVVDIDTSGEI